RTRWLFLDSWWISFVAAIMMSVVLTARRGLTARDRSILTAINTDYTDLSFVSSTFIVLCCS
ncbi:unnamed protein product, partial [Brassica oleracea var. botrytis]